MIKGESYIPGVEAPRLPGMVPELQVMRSWGQNGTTYEPDVWGLQYAGYRYLEHCSDEALKSRYLSLLRNRRAYSGPARDVVPINSYLSSWYWHRKEHQTKLEFAYRGLALPVSPISAKSMQARSSLNATPIGTGKERIFRYGRAVHLRDLVEKGALRIAPSQSYEDAALNAARRDGEDRKLSIMPGKFTQVTHADGIPIKIIGDVNMAITGSPYHLASFSCEWDDDLFDDFNEEACVVITDPDEFARRLKAAGTNIFPDWYFHYNPVSYFDPYERGKNEIIDVAMAKDFSFAYQKEFRVLWAQLHAERVDGYQFVEMGNASDIMRLLRRDESQLI